MSSLDATLVVDVIDGDVGTSNYPSNLTLMTREFVNESANLAATLGVVVCFLIAIVVIELGNSLTIASFVTDRRLRRSKYIPVVSMAVADSLFGLVAVVFLVERYLHSTTTDSPVFSVSVVIVSTMLAFTSALHLVVLAFDRFVAVRFPMSYCRVMTSCRVSIMTGACWLIAAIVTSPYMIWMVYDPRSVTDANVTCYHYDSEDGPVPLTFSYPIQFTVYVATSTTLIALSLAALAAARRSSWRRRFAFECDFSMRVLACCRWISRSRPNDDETSVPSSTHTGSSKRQLSYACHGVRQIGL